MPGNRVTGPIRLLPGSAGHTRGLGHSDLAESLRVNHEYAVAVAVIHASPGLKSRFRGGRPAGHVPPISDRRANQGVSADVAGRMQFG
jgi:hypothetical protein